MTLTVAPLVCSFCIRTGIGSDLPIAEIYSSYSGSTSFTHVQSVRTVRPIAIDLDEVGRICAPIK